MYVLASQATKRHHKATKRHHINITVANLSKTILETPGGWPSSTVAHQETYKNKVVDMTDRREEKAVGQLGKRRAPDAWSNSNEKRHHGMAKGHNKRVHHGWTRGAGPSRPHRGWQGVRGHF